MRRSECHSRRISRPRTGAGEGRYGVTDGTSHATRGRGRVFGAFVAVALVVTACRSGANPTASPTAVVAVAGTAHVPAVSPCGPGTAGASDEIGVAADAITVGVVADVTGVACRLPFQLGGDAGLRGLLQRRGGHRRASPRRPAVRLQRVPPPPGHHRRLHVGVRARRLGGGVRRRRQPHRDRLRASRTSRRTSWSRAQHASPPSWLRCPAPSSSTWSDRFGISPASHPVRSAGAQWRT